MYLITFDDEVKTKLKLDMMIMMTFYLLDDFDVSEHEKTMGGSL